MRDGLRSESFEMISSALLRQRASESDHPLLRKNHTQANHPERLIAGPCVRGFEDCRGVSMQLEPQEERPSTRGGGV